MKKYDYLVVGAGLFGSVFARIMADNNKRVLVIDKRNHVGGNIYTENIEGINVHKYGAHIFHTNDEYVWNFVNKYSKFNRFTNSPIAVYKDEIYSLPFNMYTFNKMWGCKTPEEAKKIIDSQKTNIENPKNLEEQAINLVGKDIYETLINGYTQKQWGRKCNELPPEIIKRLPVRFNYDNNYFNALYQGIPVKGYTNLIENLLKDIDIKLNCDYFDNKEIQNIAEKIIFTGPIDKFFDYKFGTLEYRTVDFETTKLEINNFQGNAVVNYTDLSVPYTRIIEHKWFNFGKDEFDNEIKNTIISKEYSTEWNIEKEPYYPINNDKNNKIYEKYKEYSKTMPNVIFGGRLGEYKYYDMDVIIKNAIYLTEKELNNMNNKVKDEKHKIKFLTGKGYYLQNLPDMKDGYFAMSNVFDPWHDNLIVCSCCENAIFGDTARATIPNECPNCNAKIEGRIIIDKETFKSLKNLGHIIEIPHKEE